MHTETRRVSENTITELRTQGEKLLGALNEELYLNLSGLKHESDTEGIFNAHRDFGDPELFKSMNEESQSAGVEKVSTILLSGFLAEVFIKCGAAGLSDKILTLEATRELSIGKKRIPYRSAMPEILREPGKQKRDGIERHRAGVVEELNPVFREKLYIEAGCSESLGFASYVELREHTGGAGIRALSEEAKLFIRDTEYISKEMLDWFFMKRMGFPSKDATACDTAYMLNSFELGRAFPKTEYTLCAARLLDDAGLTNSADVTVDEVKRSGKAFGGLFFLIDPPLRMAVSILPAGGGPVNYESYLGTMGSALSYAFTDREEDFELRYLRDSGQTEIFSELFKNLIFERRWLKRYLGIDEDSDFYRFLYLRRLIAAREDAGRLVYEVKLYGNEDVNGLQAIYKEIMEEALLCEVNEWDFLNIREPLTSAGRFRARLIEPSLRKYLQENFDEEWWRVEDAGSYLKGIWCKGGNLQFCDIAETVGFQGSASELKETFERELG